METLINGRRKTADNYDEMSPKSEKKKRMATRNNDRMSFLVYVIDKFTRWRFGRQKKTGKYISKSKHCIITVFDVITSIKSM